MKLIATTLLSMPLLSGIGLSQEFVIEWTTLLEQDVSARIARVSESGNLVLVGTSGNAFRNYLALVSPDGTLLRSYEQPRVGHLDFRTAGVTRDGRLLALEETIGNDDALDISLLEIPENPAEVRRTSWRVPGAQIGYSVLETHDGGFVSCGRSWTRENHGYIARADSSGRLSWEVVLDVEGSFLMDLCETTDGGFVAVGWTSRPHFLALRTDAEGCVVWHRTLLASSEYEDEARRVALSADGGFVIAGTREHAESGSRVGFIFKLDPNGDVDWHKTLHPGEEFNYVMPSLRQVGEASVFVATFTGPESSFIHRWRLTDSGELLDDQRVARFPTTFLAGSSAPMSTADGGVVISGVIEPPGGPSPRSDWQRVVLKFSASVQDQFNRGDVNTDENFDVSDPIALLTYLFLSASEPSCLDAADANDDGELDISDAVYLLFWMFAAGPAPLPPHPVCGLDRTIDVLDCSAYPESSCL